MADGKRKRRVIQHIMEDRSIQIIKGVMPTPWVLREYRPDYGLDLAIEVFDRANDVPDTFESLGEHFFVQVKSVKKLKARKVSVGPRLNVAKCATAPNQVVPQKELTNIEVLRLSVDTSLLTTVQAMGACTVVFLFIVTLERPRVFFVCLNDYIDKILIPENPHYSKQSKVTIRVPVSNEISPVAPVSRHLEVIKFFAKRSKLYAAFNLFHYQARELDYCQSREDFQVMAAHFLENIYRLDIWDDCCWAILHHYRGWMHHLLEVKSPVPDMEWFAGHPAVKYRTEMLSEDVLKNLYFVNIREFWHGLTVLGRNYEELCREWYLPTQLSELMRG